MGKSCVVSTFGAASAFSSIVHAYLLLLNVMLVLSSYGNLGKSAMKSWGNFSTWRVVAVFYFSVNIHQCAATVTVTGVFELSF